MINTRHRRRWRPYVMAALMTSIIGVMPAIAQYEGDELTVLGLEVHLNNMRAMAQFEGGVDNLEAFEDRTGATVRYITGTTGSLQEGLQRLGVLSETAEDIIYVNQLDANRRLTTYLSPLSEVLGEGAVEGFPQTWPAGVVAASTIDDELYLLPLRCGTFTLWYNQGIFDELEIAAPPTTPEELYELASLGTFTRESGEQVFGFLPRGDKWSLTEDMTVLARMFGGDLITEDFEVVLNQEPAVKAVEMLQRMYREGILPSNWASIDGATQAELFRNERATMVIGGANYDGQYNQQGSRIDGKAVPAHMPLAEELKTPEQSFSPSIIWFWGVGMLNGASDKELGGEFVRHIASAEVQRELAANGNGPCTSDVLSELATTSPGMALAEEIFTVSSPPIPAHANMNQVRDLMGETIQNIVVGGLDAQSELDAVARQIERLLR